MTYIKPLCDCNNELTLTVHEMDSMDFQISDKGKLVKSSVKHSRETILLELSCRNCGNLYESETDEKNRLTRGPMKKQDF